MADFRWRFQICVLNLNYLLKCPWSLFIWIPLTKRCPLQWRHNERNGVSNHRRLVQRLFRRRSKKTSKLRVTCLCEGNPPGPVDSPHKGPATWKLFPFDDVIMHWLAWCLYTRRQAFTWTDDDPVHRSIYASLGLNVFILYSVTAAKRRIS